MVILGKTLHFYVIEGHRYRYWKNMLGEIKCHKCRKIINEGDKIVSKKKRSKMNGKSRNLYCEKCARELYLI
jgi:hypothetical protein